MKGAAHVELKLRLWSCVADVKAGEQLKLSESSINTPSRFRAAITSATPDRQINPQLVRIGAPVASPAPSEDVECCS